ncbi:unnamed protein product [Cylindrotheca closterium]|uniref:DUF4461 domain-containing protein n=1 Tax=Cylindrotheca closterium TaxID=2856 RepID=A0AAD2FGR7_9STRA|nr:unnamed protein product [Cylindrotheca closterium]
MSQQALSRSTYVGNVRRAVLLRAHPDRFRSHGDDERRRRQETLLKELGARISESDFSDYTTYRKSQIPFRKGPSRFIPFALERRDGSILDDKLDINDSVEGILQSLANLLKKSGAVPPKPPPADEPVFNQDANIFDMPQFDAIDRRFDLNTAKGRNLLSFVDGLDSSEVERRRTSRLDAVAIASVARQMYSFQAIDGIRLGWSSQNFAVLVSSVVSLHEEHSKKFNVTSFYPLRLVFTPDEMRDPLDLHGGTIYLHPADTQLQWLNVLQEVTESKLLELEHNREMANQRTSLLQNALGVKVVKGYSCSSREYHIFLAKMAESLSETLDSTNDESTALQVESLRVVVESPSASRRIRLTEEGYIRGNSAMSESDLRKAIARLAHDAQDRMKQEKEYTEKCKEMTRQIQYSLGLQRVFRKGVVSRKEFLISLGRLLEQSSNLGNSLSGFSLGIGTSGVFAHLSDDGSLIVPYDWR